MDAFGLNLILPLVFGGVAAAGGIAEAVRRSRARRRVAAGSVVLGDHVLVTITGYASEVGPALAAPLTGRRCLAYCARAHVYEPGARRAGRPLVTVHARTELAGFELQGPAGAVRVEGSQVELAMRPRKVPRDHARQQAFVAGFGLPYQPDLISFDEIVVLPGQLVTVHGIARLEVDAGASHETGFREAPRRARIIGDDRHAVLLTDA